MTKLRRLWLLTALASVVALAGGYFLLVSPKNSKAAALREETETQLQLNRDLQSQIQMLNRQKKDLPRQQAELQRFAAKIPNNPALPALIRSLSDAADNAGVELMAISPGAPAPVTTSAGTATTAAGATTAAAPAAARLSLAAIPVNLKITGSYSEISQFFSELERLPRAFLVNGFALGGRAGAANASSPLAGAGAGQAGTVAPGDLTLSVNGQLYMTTKPPARAPQPAATTVVE